MTKKKAKKIIVFFVVLAIPFYFFFNFLSLPFRLIVSLLPVAAASLFAAFYRLDFLEWPWQN